ncbi:DUF3995 domain-containing protein [Actinomycetospora sp. NBC_00405]|uniref:DUF3995 domain-containing protein n=1 Tax=Actinomycetospora sp. NBC_00405 TaxID=2975952 RepID=UPI002E248410
MACDEVMATGGCLGTTRPTAVAGSTAWAGYLAAAVGSAFAAVSLYWAAGGTAGLCTIGGPVEDLTRARDPQFIALLWATAVAKIIGAVLGLALVRPWGQRVPRRTLFAGAEAAAVLLTLYGAVQTGAVALAATGFLDVEPIDPTVLRWRMFLWEPWFLVWGLLLGIAVRQRRRRPIIERTPRCS